MRRSRWVRVVLLVVLLPGLVLVPGIDTVSADEHDDDNVGGNDDGPLPDEDDEADDGDEADDDETDGGEEDVANETEERGENETDDGITSGGTLDPRATEATRDEEDDSSSGLGLRERAAQMDPRNLPESLVNHVVEWIDEHAQSTFEAILEGSIEFAVSTPTMDNDGWMGVFGTPTDDHYGALYNEIYIGAVSPVVLFFMVLSIMVVATVLPFGSFFNSYKASSWALMIMGGIVAFALSWPITSMMHFTADSIAAWFAPSGEELANNLPQLGSASLAAAGGIYLFGWLEAIIFALVWGFRWTLLYMVMPFLFPFALSFALLGPHRVIRQIGSLFIWSYIGLLIMPWPAALLFNAAISTNWGFDAGGIAGVILTLGTLVIAILLPLAIMKAMFITNTLMAGSAGAISGGLSRRSQMGYGVKTPQQARHVGGRARDIASGGMAVGRSQAMNLGERIGFVSNEKKPSLDPRLHRRGRATGSTQAERTTMVRQASRDQASSRRSIGQIGGHRTDVNAYRHVSN